MIYNAYNTFMIWSAEWGRRTVVDSDDKTINYDNPLFGRINDAPRCVIALHVTPTKNSRNRSYFIETQYLLQVDFKVCWKNTTHVCLGYADTDEVKNEMWVYQDSC